MEESFYKIFGEKDNEIILPFEGREQQVSDICKYLNKKKEMIGFQKQNYKYVEIEEKEFLELKGKLEKNIK